MKHTSSLWPMVVLLLSFFPAETTAKHKIPCPSDPFLSPSTDICNPLRYITSNALTAVAVSLYTLSALTMTYFMWKRGGRFMMAMVIGSYTMALGLAMRFGLHVQPDSNGIYIVEYLFVILSKYWKSEQPCAFIAAVYVLLGRLARYLGMDRHLLINPRRITQVFISSDIATFLVQAVGGVVSISGSTSGNVSTSNLGSNIFLAGLALQLTSFFIFALVFAVFIYRVHKFEPDVWNMRKTTSVSLPWYRDWRVLAFAITLSCIGILIRSAYRTVELSQGFEGSLARSEGFFYGLDTYPLFVAVAVYLPFWPGDFIHEMKGENSVATSDADIEKDSHEN